LRSLETDPVAFVGGRVLPHEPSDRAVGILARERREEIRPGTFVDAGTIFGSNMAFRREVLESVGGFDEALGHGTPFGCEDADTVARASAAGFHGAYDPRVVVRHHHGRKGPEVEQLLRAYDIGRGAFYAKCALDRRMRRTYVGAWVRIAPRRARERGVRTVARELLGALRYLRHRARRRAAGANGSAFGPCR